MADAPCVAVRKAGAARSRAIDMERTETTDQPAPDEASSPHDEPPTHGDAPGPPGVRTYGVDVEPVAAGNGTPPGESADAEAAELAAAHAAAAEDEGTLATSAEAAPVVATDADTSGSVSPQLPGSTFSDVSLTGAPEDGREYVATSSAPAVSDAPLTVEDLGPPGDESAPPSGSTDPSDTIVPAEPGTADSAPVASVAAEEPAAAMARPAADEPTPTEPAAEQPVSVPALVPATSAGDPRRREFMKKALAVLAGGAAAAIPAAVGIRVFLDPLGRKQPEGGSGTGSAPFIPVTTLAALPDDGRPHQFQVLADKTDAWTVVRNVPVGAVYLIRQGNYVTAFNVVCPHAGCFVDVAPAGSDVTFACPCHRSSFRTDGSFTPGSVSPRGLDRLEVDREALAAGEIHVQFQNFEAGRPDKKAV
jgi:Rieske Fe-S protein